MTQDPNAVYKYSELYVDSRDTTNLGTPNHIRFPLPKAIDNIKGFKCIETVVPFTFDPVSQTIAFSIGFVEWYEILLNVNFGPTNYMTAAGQQHEWTFTVPATSTSSLTALKAALIGTSLIDANVQRNVYMDWREHTGSTSEGAYIYEELVDPGSGLVVPDSGKIPKHCALTLRSFVPLAGVNTGKGGNTLKSVVVYRDLTAQITAIDSTVNTSQYQMTICWGWDDVVGGGLPRLPALVNKVNSFVFKANSTSTGAVADVAVSSWLNATGAIDNTQTTLSLRTMEMVCYVAATTGDFQAPFIGHENAWGSTTPVYQGGYPGDLLTQSIYWGLQPGVFSNKRSTTVTPDTLTGFPADSYNYQWNPSNPLNGNSWDWRIYTKQQFSNGSAITGAYQYAPEYAGFYRRFTSVGGANVPFTYPSGGVNPIVPPATVITTSSADIWIPSDLASVPSPVYLVLRSNLAESAFESIRSTNAKENSILQIIPISSGYGSRIIYTDPNPHEQFSCQFNQTASLEFWFTLDIDPSTEVNFAGYPFFIRLGLWHTVQESMGMKPMTQSYNPPEPITGRKRAYQATMY